MPTPDFTQLILRALVDSDLIGTLFRAALPAGATFTVQIPRVERASAVFCPGGCAAQIRIRSVSLSALSATMPYRATLAVDLDVTSVAPFPVRTPLGDFAITVDTTRGANRLRYVGTVLVNDATRVPPGYVRIRPGSMSDALRLLRVNVDVSALTPEQNGQIEEADLEVVGTSTGGQFLADVINRYKMQIVARLRAEAQYAINNEVCTRFGTPPCPPKPAMPDIDVAAGVPGIAKYILGAGVLVLAIRALRRW